MASRSGPTDSKGGGHGMGGLYIEVTIIPFLTAGLAAALSCH